MIKYECDMCHEIFGCMAIRRYDIPRICDGYDHIHIAPTHLCEDCARKLASMFKEYKDEDY